MVNHHQLLGEARGARGALLWCNNHLLFWMSLIPISTAFLGENPFAPIGVAAYGFVLAACATAFTLLRWVVTHDGGGFATPVQAASFKKSVTATSLYALSVPLAFVSVYLSMAIFVIIPAIFFMPDLLLKPAGKRRWILSDLPLIGSSAR